MTTLSQFKQENRVTSIDLMKNKGRAYATINNKTLIVSSECKMDEPLFVIPCTKNAKDEPMPLDVNGHPTVFLLINSTSKHIATI